MRIWKRAQTVALSALLLTGMTQLAQAQTWDFETGNTTGWSKSGEAFDNQPTFENNVAPRIPGIALGIQGNYWIGTYENRRNATVPLGRIQGDAPQGRMWSDTFSPNRRYIRFLIGGGNDLQNLRVELLRRLPRGQAAPPRTPDGLGGEVNVRDDPFTYTVARVATGRNDEILQPVSWDVQDLNGQTVRIRLVDNSSGPWGHINVDDFQFLDTLPATPPPGGNTVTLTGLTLDVGAVLDVLNSRGNYRIAINGFRVNRQSADDILEGDGRGDEVYLRADVFEINVAGAVVSTQVARTLVMGHNKPIPAGSGAAGFSNPHGDGGLLSGDVFPTSTPWTRRDDPRTDRPPLLVWRGELRNTENMIVVVPSVWEWDSDGPSPEETLWNNRIGPSVVAAMANFTGPLSSWPAGESLVKIIRGPGCSNRQTRPIGSGRQPGLFELPHAILQNIPVVRVSNPSARQLLATPLTDSVITYGDGNTRTVVEAGALPRGVIPINIRDMEDLKGDYTLYLQIEQM